MHFNIHEIEPARTLVPKQPRRNVAVCTSHGEGVNIHVVTTTAAAVLVKPGSSSSSILPICRVCFAAGFSQDRPVPCQNEHSHSKTECTTALGLLAKHCYTKVALIKL